MLSNKPEGGKNDRIFKLGTEKQNLVDHGYTQMLLIIRGFRGIKKHSDYCGWIKLIIN